MDQRLQLVIIFLIIIVLVIVLIVVIVYFYKKLTTSDLCEGDDCDTLSPDKIVVKPAETVLSISGSTKPIQTIYTEGTSPDVIATTDTQTIQTIQS